MPHSVETRLERLLARQEIAAASCAPDQDFWYRPRQILVHRDDLELVADELRRWGAEEVRDEKQEPVRSTVRFSLPAHVDVPALARRLRELPDGRQVRISPNHVLAAAPVSGYGPADLPRATKDKLKLPSLRHANPRYAVGVLDTGLVLDRTRHRQGQNPHRAVHEKLVLDPARDDDELDVHPRDGVLDDVDVHGGFIADLVRHHAPKATVKVGKVLLGGVADEYTIAAAIGRMRGVQVLNLSLGGYTDANLAPFPIVEAIEALQPRPVIVAAAGNDSRRTPFWPAALKGVIGVAAVDAPERVLRRTRPNPADFTNRGPWVDACAHGVDVLSTFVQFKELKAADTVVPQAFTGWAYWSGTSFAAPRLAARIIERAMQLDDEPTRAAHRAAWEILNDPSAQRLPDLGVFVA